MPEPAVTRADSTKPFLLLSTRGEEAAAHAEHLSFARTAGVAPAKLHQIRLEKGLPSALSLDDYSGIIVGGGPFNSSDEIKSGLQKRVESWFDDVLAEVLDRDFPFLGACYGVGLLGMAGSGSVSRRHGEEADVITIKKTAEGTVDPILEGLPTTFHGIVGHKEAIDQLPADATLLATGDNCPVQMFRIGANAYATQFHPELDADTFAQRLRIYSNQGYYQPGSDSAAVEAARRLDVKRSGQILRNFARIHVARRV